MIAASGGRSAAASSASCAVAAGIDLEAGLAQHDASARAGSAARRRRRARGGVAHGAAHLVGRLGVGLGASGNVDHEASCPGRAATRPHTSPPLASTKPLTIARPRPEPAWPPRRCRRGRTARRSARSSPAGMPGPRSTIRTIRRLPDRPARAPRRDARRSSARAFSSRFAKARSSWAASASIERQVGVDVTARSALAGRADGRRPRRG